MRHTQGLLLPRDELSTTMDQVPVLAISGSVGVGKTTIALAIHDLFSSWSVPHACIDRDALTWSWPAEGLFNSGLGHRNLAAIWDNFRAAGARRLILAGVLETDADRNAYAKAIPGALVTVCRLVAPLAVRHERLRTREHGTVLEWHVARSLELDQVLDASTVNDFVVENHGRSPEVVAHEVLRRAGWPVGEFRGEPNGS